MSLQDLQLEHAAWIRTMYPGQPPIIPAMGLAEEGGELAQAVSKREQCRIWGNEARYANVDWNAKLIDAVGDCAIYVCSLCNAVNWDFQEIVRTACTLEGNSSDTVWELVAELQACAAVVVCNPTLKPTLIRYTRALFDVCSALGMDFHRCVGVTWEIVKRRTR